MRECLRKVFHKEYQVTRNQKLVVHAIVSVWVVIISVACLFLGDFSATQSPPSWMSAWWSVPALLISWNLIIAPTLWVYTPDTMTRDCFSEMLNMKISGSIALFVMLIGTLVGGPLFGFWHATLWAAIVEAWVLGCVAFLVVVTLVVRAHTYAYNRFGK